MRKRLTFDHVRFSAEPTMPALLGERYRVLRLLGEGAVGAVYLAEHIHMRKRVAVKVLHREVASPEVVWRFRAEAIAAANIGHPGIAEATDFGELPDGSMYLVLEHVAGEPLSAVIARGPLPTRRALRIARNVLCALGAAHRKGIVHRDVKPANIMLCDGDAGVKLLDFGVAHLDRRVHERSDRFTAPGLLYGTADYMAPEQASGSEIDARADLYAVGAVLYELISGRTPFAGSAFEVLAAQMSTPPPPLGGPSPRSITRETHELVARLLAKRADLRPANATEAITLVDAALASLEQPVEPLPATRRPPQRRPRVLIAAALLTTMLAVIAMTRSREPQSEIVGARVRNELPAPPPPVPPPPSPPVVAAKPPTHTVKAQPPAKAKAKKPAQPRGFARLRNFFS